METVNGKSLTTLWDLLLECDFTATKVINPSAPSIVKDLVFELCWRLEELKNIAASFDLRFWEPIEIIESLTRVQHKNRYNVGADAGAGVGTDEAPYLNYEWGTDEIIAYLVTLHSVTNYSWEGKKRPLYWWWWVIEQPLRN